VEVKCARSQCILYVQVSIEDEFEIMLVKSVSSASAPMVSLQQ
jgi:hypothetical protein